VVVGSGEMVKETLEKASMMKNWMRVRGISANKFVGENSG
jgi:hypothetical protein